MVHTTIKYGHSYQGTIVTTRATAHLGDVYPHHSDTSTAQRQAFFKAPRKANPLDVSHLPEDLIRRKSALTKGTYEWVLSDPYYVVWLDSPKAEEALIWVSGSAGKGKTMLSVFLAQKHHEVELRSSNPHASHYFCKNSDPYRSSALAVLLGLVRQVLAKEPALFRHLENDIYQKEDDLFGDASIDSLWSCFVNMTEDESISRIFLVLDGLNECEDSSTTWPLEKLKNQICPITSHPPSPLI